LGGGVKRGRERRCLRGGRQAACVPLLLAMCGAPCSCSRLGSQISAYNTFRLRQPFPISRHPCFLSLTPCLVPYPGFPSSFHLPCCVLLHSMGSSNTLACAPSSHTDIDCAVGTISQEGLQRRPPLPHAASPPSAAPGAAISSRPIPGACVLSGCALPMHEMLPLKRCTATHTYTHTHGRIFSTSTPSYPSPQALRLTASAAPVHGPGLARLKANRRPATCLSL